MHFDTITAYYHLKKCKKMYCMSQQDLEKLPVIAIYL